MKVGMNSVTGKPMTGLEYLKQRLSDVINTPRGAVVGRRDFGSRLHEIVDHNVTSDFYMDAYIRLAEAVNDPANGLDDFQLVDMSISRAAENHIEINLTGVFVPTGEQSNFNLNLW